MNLKYILITQLKKNYLLKIKTKQKCLNLKVENKHIFLILEFLI